MSEVEDVALPNIEEMPKEQILALEKEITGFYITGHPLDKYRERMQQFMTIESLTETEKMDGKIVKIAGLIVNSKRISTKKGETMCFIEVEDFTNKIEVVVFPKVFYQSINVLIPDTPVIVSGRLNVNEESAKILADSIMNFDEYEPVIRIRIRKSQETEDIFSKLKEIFESYGGKNMVYLHLVDSRKVIKTEEKFWFAPIEEAINKIEMILGKGAVQIK